MEKHITLLEELEIKNKRMDYLNLKEYGLFEIEAVKAFISSREEKAREEGRKEGYAEGCRDVMSNEEILKLSSEVRTQYKEELRGKLPEEETGDDFEWGSHAEGWNDYREAVIKLL